jgi:hypothetical protein
MLSGRSNAMELNKALKYRYFCKYRRWNRGKLHTICFCKLVAAFLKRNFPKTDPKLILLICNFSSLKPTDSGQKNLVLGGHRYILLSRVKPSSVVVGLKELSVLKI